MILETPRANIGDFLGYFMTKSSKEIGKRSSRINHIYGGRNYKNLVMCPYYYAHCFKYIARNPVKAGVVDSVAEYPWSTLYPSSSMANLVSLPLNGHDEFLPSDKLELIDWLDEPTPKELEVLCDNAMKRPVFEFKPCRKTQKRWVLKDGLYVSATHPQKVPGT